MTPNERRELEARAAAKNMSVAAYPRSAGLGYQARSVIGRELAIELLQIVDRLDQFGGLDDIDETVVTELQAELIR